MRISIDVLPARVPTGLGVYTRRMVTALLQEATTVEWFLVGDDLSLSLIAPELPAHCVNLARGHFGSHAGFPPIPERHEWRVAVGQLLDRLRPDLHFGPAFALPLGHRCPPMAATVHDVTFCTRPEEFSDETRRYYLDITADAGARACAIVCDSLHTKHELQRYFRVERARVRVVSPCIPSTFRPADIAKLVRVRRDYTLPDRFFLHVPGGWIPRKNTMRLLEAYHQLRTEEGSTCPDLVIVSPAPFVLPALKARIPEMVRLIDYVSDEDLPAVMSGAVAMVYPSLEEGFGLPVAEALACGVTVVIADRPVFREVAGPQAIYVDPENPTSIAAGLKQAASETRDVMRVAARIARAARFRPERSAARMLAVFRRCLRDSID